MAKSDSKLISILEGARRCGVSRWTMQRWVQERKIPAVHLPMKGVRLDPRDVERFIARHRTRE